MTEIRFLVVIWYLLRCTKTSVIHNSLWQALANFSWGIGLHLHLDL